MPGDDIQHQHLVIRFLHNTFVFDINLFLYPSTTTAHPPRNVGPLADYRPAEVVKDITLMRLLH